MDFFKKLWHFVIAFICAPMRPVAYALAHRPQHATSKDVRIIKCISPNLPRILWGLSEPKDYIGVISSDFPGKCMIPESAATFVTHANWDIPTQLPKLVSLSGFEQTLFYPFRELAEALGYDVLWCTFKEPGSKDYTGHVLFAEHVRDGVWIRVSKDYAQRNFVKLYNENLYTGGWLYAIPLGSPQSPHLYTVQRYTDIFYVDPNDVLEVVDPIKERNRGN